ncbi:MAG: ABC transporter ATP-binding protein [Armatimonadota bacterium]|nr:ABC transporter ATP-binding protein [Armatimonadota bacterium]MDR7464049.1 ABC transporter ATP-binding protein [Armatimonadota bacterium]MDR7469037.1 ABC transporter ATP-binding protein [Armatimonadota bacterium]MDR7475614.1 ABC transporter ATP-binding protein [Armatimonadota bacterium]MDR7538078.1 ABC transporter ATP-binding protein [Armatimonadota bacterium]
MTDHQDETCLALVEVSKYFGGLHALEGVSLVVRRGERRAIIGPNGAGKTTLFNLITGELPVTAGRVVLFGRDITRLPPHRRCGLGLGRTFQITNLFPTLSVLENVLLALLGTRRLKLAAHRPLAAYRDLFGDARRLLEPMGLWEKHALPITSLSYGEQRQIEVTLALASRPKLLLLDEPTAGLSPGEVKVLIAIIRSLDPSITVLLIEHDMDVAFEVAERITVLHLGRVIAEGTTDQVRANPEVQQIYLGVEG